MEEHMKLITALIVSATLVASSGAFAQNPPAKNGPGNNAVNNEQKNSNAPVAGRNSFTEGQAQSAIEKAGYTNVTGLKKDDNGVWRGMASKSGATSNVSVDFQGNVNASK
jgi:opacity protein-like surface antigen